MALFRPTLPPNIGFLSPMLQIGKNRDGQYPFRFRRTVNQPGQAVMHDLGHGAERCSARMNAVLRAPVRSSQGSINIWTQPKACPPFREGFADERARRS